MPGLRAAMQLAGVQDPDIAAGDGIGCPVLQPEPEVDAVTLPERLVGTTVPVVVPLMEQLLHVRPENGMENVPVLLTTVVPVDCAVQLWTPEPPGGLNRGRSALIA
jgi:hypothetical protein